MLADSGVWLEICIDHMLHIVTDMVTRAMDVAHHFHHYVWKNLRIVVVVSFWLVSSVV